MVADEQIGAALDAKPPYVVSSAGPLSGKLGSAVVWSAIQAWGAQLVSLLVFALLARLLEPEAFGLITLAAVFVSIVKSFVDQGLGTAIIQRQDLEPPHLDSVFWVSVAIGAACSIIGAAAAGVIAQVFGDPRLANVVRWLSLIFVIDALGTVQQAVLRRHFAFRLLALRGLVSIALGGIVGVVLASRGWGVNSLVAQQITTAAAGTILVWGVEKWKPRLRFSRSHARELIGFGYNILGIRFLTVTARRSDDVLIGYFLGTVALGYYGVAYKVFKVLLEMLAAVVGRVALPALSLLQTDEEGFPNAVSKATMAVALVAFPCFVGLSVTARDVIPIFFGETWLPSVRVMQVLALAGVGQCLALVFQQSLIAYGRPSAALRVLVVTTGSMLVGFVVAARYGIVWVAAAFAIVSLLMLPVQILVLRRLVKLSFAQVLSALRPAILGLLLMTPTLMLWTYAMHALPASARLAGGIVIGAVMYTVGALLGRPSLLGEMRALREVRGEARPMGATDLS